MTTYNLIEFSNNYSKTSGSLWHSYKDEKTFDNNISVAQTTANSKSFKNENEFTGIIHANGTKYAEIAVLLNFVLLIVKLSLKQLSRKNISLQIQLQNFKWLIWNSIYSLQVI